MANFSRRLNEKLKSRNSDDNYRIVKKFIIKELSNKSLSHKELMSKAKKQLKISNDETEHIIKKIFSLAIEDKISTKIITAKIHKGNEYYTIK